MKLSVAFQMDALEGIDTRRDSSFAMALEAQRRGHQLYHYLPRDMSLRHAATWSRAELPTVV